jgi:acyl-CoA reductase-like NAD-dependent aldehyde dehydrogenase
MASVEQAQTVEQELPSVNGSTPNGSATNGAPALATIEVENPATGEIVASVPDLGAEAIAEMARRARAAQPAWQAYGFDGRARILLRAQKWLMDNADQVISTIISETGKTFEDASLAEISYAGNAFGFWAKHGPEYLADERVKSSQLLVKGKKLIMRYRPLGLIGVIGPWNYPLTNSFGDCIPALMAGNSVILKPSEITPLTSLLLADALGACGLPQDVLQIATGRGETGAALVDEADMIMFTGSTRTGKRIMERAAQTLTPVSLELGGKDPMIVLADADLERAANTAVYCSMQNSGQTCISIERVYVEEPIYEPFVAKVTEKVAALRQGDPSGGAGTVEIGAMTFPPQVDLVADHVADALAKGARAVVGGHRGQGAGHYFEPTVLVDVDHTMKCMTEETFGPTLPIMKVRDVDEAVRLANDSPYGLSSSVFGRDTVRAEAVGRRIQSGAVCINDAMMNYLALELPMGGAKTSGLGSRHGARGRSRSSTSSTTSPTRRARPACWGACSSCSTGAARDRSDERRPTRR